MHLQKPGDQARRPTRRRHQPTAIHFTLYIANMPPPPPSNIQVVTYADDTTIFQATPTSPRPENPLKNASPFIPWLEDRKLQLSAPKSSVTVFSSANADTKFQPKITIKHDTIPVNKNPIWASHLTRFSHSNALQQHSLQSQTEKQRIARSGRHNMGQIQGGAPHDIQSNRQKRYKLRRRNLINTTLGHPLEKTPNGTKKTPFDRRLDASE
jgi:hypothetical protein